METNSVEKRNLSDTKVSYLYGSSISFEDFVAGLRRDQLNGFQSSLRQKFILKAEEITYVRGQQIYHSLQTATSVRMKKNWKAE